MSQGLIFIITNNFKCFQYPYKYELLKFLHFYYMPKIFIHTTAISTIKYNSVHFNCGGNFHNNKKKRIPL